MQETLGIRKTKGFFFFFFLNPSPLKCRSVTVKKVLRTTRKAPFLHILLFSHRSIQLTTFSRTTFVSRCISFLSDQKTFRKKRSRKALSDCNPATFLHSQQLLQFENVFSLRRSICWSRNTHFFTVNRKCLSNDISYWVRNKLCARIFRSL